MLASFLAFSCKIDAEKIDLRNQVEELAAELEEEKAKNQKLNEQVAAMNAKVDSKETELTNVNSELNIAIEKLKTSLMQEQELRNLAVVELERVKTDTDAIKIKNNELNDKIIELSSIDVVNRTEIEKLLGQINNLTNDYNSLLKENAVTNENLDVLKKNYETLANNNTALQKEYAESNAKISQLETELKELKEEQQKINNAFMSRKLRQFYSSTNFDTYYIQSTSQTDYDRLSNLFVDIYLNRNDNLDQRVTYEKTFLENNFSINMLNINNVSINALYCQLQDYGFKHPEGITSINDFRNDQNYIFQNTLDFNQSDKVFTNIKPTAKARFTEDTIYIPYVGSYKVIKKITEDYDNLFLAKYKFLGYYLSNPESSVRSINTYILYFYDNVGRNTNAYNNESNSKIASHGYFAAFIYCDEHKENCYIVPIYLGINSKSQIRNLSTDSIDFLLELLNKKNSTQSMSMRSIYKICFSDLL